MLIHSKMKLSVFFWEQNDQYRWRYSRFKKKKKWKKGKKWKKFFLTIRVTSRKKFFVGSKSSNLDSFIKFGKNFENFFLKEKGQKKGDFPMYNWHFSLSLKKKVNIKGENWGTKKSFFFCHFWVTHSS